MRSASNTQVPSEFAIRVHSCMFTGDGLSCSLLLETECETEGMHSTKTACASHNRVYYYAIIRVDNIYNKSATKHKSRKDNYFFINAKKFKYDIYKVNCPVNQI